MSDQKYTLTRQERETIIRRASDEDSWTIFSEDPVVLRRLERLFPGEGAEKGTSGGREWKVPRSSVRFYKPSKPRSAPGGFLRKAKP